MRPSEHGPARPRERSSGRAAQTAALRRGPDERGVRRDPDAPRGVECECRLPYRETVELLNQLGAQCEQAGQDPLDVLRGLLGRGPRHPRRYEEPRWWD